VLYLIAYLLKQASLIVPNKFGDLIASKSLSRKIYRKTHRSCSEMSWAPSRGLTLWLRGPSQGLLNVGALSARMAVLRSGAGVPTRAPPTGDTHFESNVQTHRTGAAPTGCTTTSRLTSHMTSVLSRMPTRWASGVLTKELWKAVW
jgi:hypothetical protein